MRITYTGPALKRELWGRVFPKGQVFDLSATEFDRLMAVKALALQGFEIAPEVVVDPPRKRGRPRKVRPHGQDQR